MMKGAQIAAAACSEHPVCVGGQGVCHARMHLKWPALCTPALKVGLFTPSPRACLQLLGMG
eukprot:1138294-Pelagomonas_calceolata.AAC.2